MPATPSTTSSSPPTLEITTRLNEAMANMAANIQAMMAARGAKFQAMWSQVCQHIAASHEQEMDGSMEWEPVFPDRLARLEQEGRPWRRNREPAPARDHRLDSVGVLDNPFGMTSESVSQAQVVVQNDIGPSELPSLGVHRPAFAGNEAATPRRGPGSR